MLLNEIQSHNKQWYMNLSNSTKLIQGALKLVKENKILCFSSEVCSNLLLDNSNIDQYLSAPSFLKKEVI